MAASKILNVIVTGAARSGKRAFINAIRNTEASDHRSAFNTQGVFGRVRLADVTLFLTAAPGNRPLAFVHELFAGGTVGAVLLVDSTAPEQFVAARAILNSLEQDEELTIIVAATKQDLPNAWDARDVRIALRVREGIPVVACSAHDRESVKDALITLFVRAERGANAVGAAD